MLRKVVVHGKLWGCVRNEKGKGFADNALSRMETRKLQDKNVSKNWEICIIEGGNQYLRGGPYLLLRSLAVGLILSKPLV